jgi:methionyl-tRNA formyltransferase
LPPGAITILAEGLHVICGKSTWLRLDAVQLQDRKRVSAREFANGARLGSSEQFGD